MPNGRRTKTNKKNNKVSKKFKISREPFPISKNVTLRYCQNTTLDPGAGLTAINYFYANGMYNPDKTGVLDHQPLLYDEMAVLYDHYHVTASKITVTFFAASTSPSLASGLVAVVLTDDVTASADPNTLQEQPNNIWKPIGAANGSHDVVEIKKTFNSARFFDKGKSNQNLSADTSASPAEGAYFACCFYPVTSAQDLQVININVVIEYNATFSERRQVVGS